MQVEMQGWISDVAWAEIEPLLLKDDPPKKTGRPRVDMRRVVSGILHQDVSGCTWNSLPQCYGDDSTVHRWYSRWRKSGVLDRIVDAFEDRVLAESEADALVKGMEDALRAFKEGRTRNVQDIINDLQRPDSSTSGCVLT